MKGSLIVFKDKVYKKVEDVYKSYRRDFQTVIGSLMNEKSNNEKEYSKSVEENER